MRRLALPLLVSLAVVGCQLVDDPEVFEDDLESTEAGLTAWEVQASSVHLGERVYGFTDTGDRDAWPAWVSGSVNRPVMLRFRVAAFDNAKVRIAVLGPLVNGTRATLASAGYNAPTSVAAVDVAVKTTGQLLIVVGSYNLASWASYDLSVGCKPNATSDQCNPWRMDALSVPKVGGLGGKVLSNGQQLISAYLNGGLSAIGSYEVELWRTPPGLHFLATKLATSQSSGSQVNWIFPANTIKVGDDLLFRVLPGDRLPYPDAGAWVRFAPHNQVFARLDAIDYHDLGGITIYGVASYFEGRDLFVLNRTNDGVEIDRESAVVSLPGQVGNGLGTFAISIAEPFDEDGELKPNLPHDGDILKLGRINQNETVQTLGCFEYCNDLAGTGNCTPQKVACP